MPQYVTVIHQFEEKGEKSGWHYIEVPLDVSELLNPGVKITYRVKGFLDNYPISGVALVPMGDGNFIIAINAEMRKGIGKRKGAMLNVVLEPHLDYKVDIPEDLFDCLSDEPEAMAQFNSLARSHRDYFIKWINSAKTEATRTKRIANTITAMINKMDYGALIRSLKVK